PAPPPYGPPRPGATTTGASPERVRASSSVPVRSSRPVRRSRGRRWENGAAQPARRGPAYGPDRGQRDPTGRLRPRRDVLRRPAQLLRARRHATSGVPGPNPRASAPGTGSSWTAQARSASVPKTLGVNDLGRFGNCRLRPEYGVVDEHDN